MKSDKKIVVLLDMLQESRMMIQQTITVPEQFEHPRFTKELVKVWTHRWGSHGTAKETLKVYITMSLMEEYKKREKLQVKKFQSHSSKQSRVRSSEVVL